MVAGRYVDVVLVSSLLVACGATPPRPSPSPVAGAAPVPARTAAQPAPRPPAAPARVAPAPVDPALAQEAERAFAAAEDHYRNVFVPYEINVVAGTMQEVKAAKQALDRLTVETQYRYERVRALRVPAYEVAAQVRHGETMVLHADKLLKMPIPVPVLTLAQQNPGSGAIAAYEESFVRNLAPYLDTARAAWREAIATEREHGVTPWTFRARANLTHWFP